MNQNRRAAGSDDGSDDFDRQTKQTGFSVSSSAMHRNTQLRLLDDRFEKIEEEYADDDDESEYDSNEEVEERADFDAILDEFLEKYEIVGKKMQPKLEGETSAAKLDSMRQGLIKPDIIDEEAKDLERTSRQKLTQSALEPKLERPLQKQRETWDVQSVISTYSNLENHPSLINDRGPSRRIRIDPKTGMPVLIEVERKKKQQDIEEQGESDEGDEEEEEEEDEEAGENQGAARSKAETKEEKKARKQAIKEAKKVRLEIEIRVENRKIYAYLFKFRIAEKRRNLPNPHLKTKKIVKRRFFNKSVKQKALPIFLDLYIKYFRIFM